MARICAVWIAVLLLVSGGTVVAAPSPSILQQVPDGLRQWVPWVLQAAPMANCSLVHGQSDHKLCLWPTRVTLVLDAHGGRFTQQWTLQAPDVVPLPGDATHWPLEVRVNNKPAAVIENGGRPQLQLEAGSYVVSGEFRWATLPQSLAIPQETALVSLAVNGRVVEFFERDDAGQIWLRGSENVQVEENRLELSVQRKLIDDVPLRVETNITIDVAGQSREVLLGRALLDGMTPMEIKSPLPARLEPDGRLRVQVRPGQWHMTITARQVSPNKQLTLPKAQGPWADSEIWVFEAKPELRLVSIDGASTIDPTQTQLPTEWKRLPAYQLTPGASLTLTEKQRGDSTSQLEELKLSRRLWLDMNGTGYTVSDQVSGTLKRSWRLEAQPMLQLGRVAAAGENQLITREPTTGRAGVEIRQGTLNIEADSRYEAALFRLPAVGWNHDFAQLNLSLQVPPGWRLAHATGVDHATGSWVDRWDLLDLFTLLLLTIAAARLWGIRIGVLAFFVLLLTLLEEDAPRWLWVIFFAAEALRRVLTQVLPEGRWQQVTIWIWRGVLLTLVLTLIPFSVNQVRTGLHPLLSRPWYQLQSGEDVSATQSSTEGGGMGGLGMVGARAPAPEAKAEQEVAKDNSPAAPAKRQYQQGLYALQSGAGKLNKALVSSAMKDRQDRQEQVDRQPDLTAAVQTGPGLPRWQWETIQLGFNGPVKRDQTVALWWLSPRVNLLLAWLRVLGLMALLVAMLRVSSIGTLWRDWLQRASKAQSAAMILLASFASLVAVGNAHAQGYPPDSLLEALEQRLLKLPACTPHCTSVSRLQLQATPTELTLRLQISAAAAVAVPLPGHRTQWLPTSVMVNGKAATSLIQREGQVWIALPPGVHQVQLAGLLPKRQLVQIQLPLTPHRVESSATDLVGWRLDGLNDEGIATDSLQLTRQTRVDNAAELTAEALPPFVRIERTLRLGLKWEVETRVVRQTPLGAAVLLKIPLLSGESVTSAGIQVLPTQHVLAQLGPQVADLQWRSTLKVAPDITLRAGTDSAWTEVWQLDAGSMWHVTMQGIAPAQPTDAADVRRPQFYPWADETVVLHITRPEAIRGQQLTIERSELSLTPGSRLLEARLNFTARTSRGAQHPIKLPAGAQIMSIAVDGKAQPIRQERATVIIALSPGTQRVEVAWRQTQSLPLIFRSPTIDLGTPSVNHATTITMPQNRWILFLGAGSSALLGPAVLFWPMLAVLFLICIVLGQWSLSPLKTYQWILLAIGLSQVPIEAAAVVVAWLLLINFRAQNPDHWPKPLLYNARQIACAVLTMVTLVILLAAVRQGLLGTPQMQIEGNGSDYGVLNWYADRAAAILPQPYMLSVPLYIYRATMLLWALWLAWSMLNWLRWTWRSLSTGGLWRRKAA